MDEPKPSKLSRGTIILMLVTVCIYEAINAVLNIFTPEIGVIISGIIENFHFYVWFKIKGVNFTKNPARAVGWLSMLFFDEIEGIDEISLPLGVIFTILSVRKEEKLENEKAAMLLPRKKIRDGSRSQPTRQPQRIMSDI